MSVTAKVVSKLSAVLPSNIILPVVDVLPVIDAKCVPLFIVALVNVLFVSVSERQ